MIEVNILAAVVQLRGSADGGFEAGLRFLLLVSVQSAILPPCPLKALCMSNPFNPPSRSFHLYSLCALSTTLCRPIPFASTTSTRSPLHLLPSRSEPCEPATLSALSIQAYGPRGLKPITFLTSPCQMFTTKIDKTASLDTKSSSALSPNLTPHFPELFPPITRPL